MSNFQKLFISDRKGIVLALFFIFMSNNPATLVSPDEDSSLTVNIFLLCGNFPISPVLPVAAFLPLRIGGIRTIGRGREE